jgi:hypothetical protein
LYDSLTAREREVMALVAASLKGIPGVTDRPLCHL